MKLSEDNKLLFYPPEIGTVLHLAGRPFSGGTILDNSPYGNNGTITGATWARTGQGLDYLSFDGADDRVTQAALPELGVGVDFNVGFWLRVNTLNTPYGIIGNTLDSTDRFAITVSSIGQILAGIYNGVFAGKKSGNIGDTEWHRYVYTFATSGAVGVLYRDKNLLTGSVQVSTASTVAFVLGARSDGTTENLSGGMALEEVGSGIITQEIVNNRYDNERHLFGV